MTGRNGSSNVTINIPDFTSNPPPTKYTWYRNGKKMESSKRITIVNATALLFNPLLQEDYGNYTVRAENEVGDGNGTANIDVQCKYMTAIHIHVFACTPLVVQGHHICYHQ